MRDFCEVRRCKREPFQQGPTIIVTGIGIVDREHEPIDSERRQSCHEWRNSEEPGCGDIDLIDDGLR